LRRNVMLKKISERHGIKEKILKAIYTCFRIAKNFLWSWLESGKVKEIIQTKWKSWGRRLNLATVKQKRDELHWEKSLILWRTWIRFSTAWIVLFVSFGWNAQNVPLNARIVLTQIDTDLNHVVCIVHLILVLQINLF